MNFVNCLISHTLKLNLFVVVFFFSLDSVAFSSGQRETADSGSQPSDRRLPVVVRLCCQIFRVARF